MQINIYFVLNKENLQYFLISSMKILKVLKYLNINRNVTGFSSQWIQFLVSKVSKKLNTSRSNKTYCTYISFFVELCVCYPYLLISWMKKLKFGNAFIINRILSNFPSQWNKFWVSKIGKKKKLTKYILITFCYILITFCFRNFWIYL